MMDFLDIPILFGRFLVIQGLLTDADVARASAVQKDLNATLCFVLIERGMLSVEDFGRVHAYQWEHMVAFEEALRAVGVLSEQACTAAVKLLDDQRIRLGEVLVGQGKITREALADALILHREHQRSSSENTGGETG
ncbi:hypothetical protein [Thiocystis violacea]|uniref:hypothetical protein n=1 Tax=Thiocystis violacea TaxID=13725 RepID=UPI0019060F14|nr:hypothetical protein [Thiocystis violacea]MBK1723157.1 hypothetical protein [Thiocystis violacea]